MKKYRAKMTEETIIKNSILKPGVEVSYTEWFDTEEEAAKEATHLMMVLVESSCEPMECDGYDPAVLLHNNRLSKVKKDFYFTIESADLVHQFVGHNFKVKA